MKINYALYIELLEREVERLRAQQPKRQGAHAILGVDDDGQPSEYTPPKGLTSDG